jgi:hypothetical protein
MRKLFSGLGDGMTDVDSDRATRYRVIMSTIEIEDVTDAQADEFVRQLTDPGELISLTLADGFEYEAVVVSGAARPL